MARAAALLCVAVLALVAAPALGASCTPTACTAPSWACDRCNAITDAESQCRCIKYLNRGYQVAALEGCAAAKYDNWRAACFDDCVGKLPLGQEWRCAKCAPSTVVDVLYCYVSEGRANVGADATATCASLVLPGVSSSNDYYGRSGYSCTDCLYLAANKIGSYNDWRCLACNVPELLAFSADGWTDAARKRCYALVAGADPDSKSTVKRVDEVSDVVTCSKIPGASLREQCYSCLQSRTGSGTTWACAQCAGKTAAAAATCLTCLTTTDAANLWQCTNA